MNDRELMQQVLDALEYIYTETTETEDKVIHAAITALRDRLAQLEQELVIDCPRCGHCCPQRKWVGLTKEEAKEISMANRPYVIDMIAALEARLKEKNTCTTPQPKQEHSGFLDSKLNPIKRPWVGLTDEEIEVFIAHLYPLPEKPVRERLRVLLEALKERNT